MIASLNLNDISTGGGMIIIAGAFCAFAFAKGLVRMIFALIALGLGGLAAVWGYRNGEKIASNIVDKPEEWMSIGVAVIAGIGVFSFARAICRFLTSGFNDTAAAKKVGFGPPAGLAGLLMGAIFAYAAVAGVRYMGTISELRQMHAYMHTAEKDKKPLEPPTLSVLKQKIDESKPGKWVSQYDIINDETRAQIAKAFLVRPDPLRFEKLRFGGKSSELLSTVTFSPNLSTLAKEKKFPQLLNDKKVKETAGLDEVKKVLSEIDIEKTIGMRK